MNHYDATINKYKKLGLNMTYWKFKEKKEISLLDMSEEYLKFYINTFKPNILKQPINNDKANQFNDRLKARIHIFEDVLHKRRFMKIDRIKNKIK